MIRGKYKLGIFSNKWLLVAIVASLILQAIVVYTPVSSFFGVVALEWVDWLVIIGAAVALYLVNAAYYWVRGMVKGKK